MMALAIFSWCCFAYPETKGHQPGGDAEKSLALPETTA